MSNDWQHRQAILDAYKTPSHTNKRPSEHLEPGQKSRF